MMKEAAIWRLRQFSVIIFAVCLNITGISLAAEAETKVSHGLSHGGHLKYPADFTHFDYANPDAPKGGEIRLSGFGSFDSLNPYILKGDFAIGGNLVFETLMDHSEDEPSSDYGLIAESVEVPDDISWAAFKLRPEARWHDGTPITAEDVIFSFDIIKAKGRPRYRTYYKNVARAERSGPRTVKFTFSGGFNRELPIILGQLPVFQKAYFETREFDKTTLEPIMGSGPYRITVINPGRSITYERVKDYWGKNLPVRRGQYNFDRIRYDYYRDSTIAREAFKSHEFDYRFENSANAWATGYDIPAVRDGRMVRDEIPHSFPTPLQAFIFNTRRDLFQDSRVREALSQAFDFEWTNKNLFHGLYTRSKSYFPNSDWASSGLPTEAELKYLDPLRGQIPNEVFTTEYAPPKSDGTGNIRTNLRQAFRLLREAGWRVRDGKLTHEATGRVMAFEIMLISPTFERIVLPFARNLEKLGVEVNVRTVDTAQYQNRLNEFDFDMAVTSFLPIISPGNEQREYWGSSNADIPGARNLIGIKNPAVDVLIEHVIGAPDRATLVAASHALDRVLLWNHYIIPNWYSRVFRIAYWDRFGRPAITPRYRYGLIEWLSWWVDPNKDAALTQKTGGKAK